MERLFKATVKQPAAPSIAELAIFLEAYINLQFPKNDIHHWITDHEDKDILKNHLISGVTERVQPKPQNKEEHIGVVIFFKEGEKQQICFAKSSNKNTWKNIMIADAIADVVRSIYLCHEIPLIVNFANSLPSADLAILEGESIQFFHDETTLDVVVNGHPIAVYDFTDNGASALQDVENHLDDWYRLAGNLKMNRSSINKNRENEQEDESSFNYV